MAREVRSTSEESLSLDGHVPSERDLVLAFQAGSPGADEEIYRLCRPVAERICRRLLSNPDDADEALQETLLRVFQALVRFNGRFALRAWVARIATNVCLDTLRARSRRPENGDGLDEEIVELFVDRREGAAPDPSEILEQTDEARRVRAVLATLPHAHRAALILREFEGLSHEEIAWALDLTPARVKALIHRAKRGFRRSWGVGSFLPFPLVWGLRRLWGGSHGAPPAEAAAVPPPLVMSATLDGGLAVLSERFVAVVAAVVVTGATVSMSPAAQGRPGEPAESDIRIVVAPPPPDAPARKATAKPSPTPEPSPSLETSTSPQPSVSPEATPAEAKLEEAPAAVPTAKPSPSADPSPEAPKPPKPPPYSARFDIAWSAEYGCDCGDGLRLVDHFIHGQPGVDIRFGQRLQGAAHDAEGDPAWRVEAVYEGGAYAKGSWLEGSFTLWTPEGSYTYDFSGMAEPVRTRAYGASWYVFKGRYEVKSGPGGFDRVPRSGTLRAELAWEADGTPVRTALTLGDATP